MRRHARRAYAYLDAHPYRDTALRGFRLGFLHGIILRGVTGVGFNEVPGVYILLLVLVADLIMRRTTNRAVGHRLRFDHLPRIDDVWAACATSGFFVALLAIHVGFHWGRVDPIGCLFRW